MHAGRNDGVVAVNEALDIVCDLLAAAVVPRDLPAQLAPKLCTVCNARVCVFGEIIGDLRSPNARWRPRAEHGWRDDPQRERLVSSLNDLDARNPAVVELLNRPGEFRTHTRRELVSDQVWYGSRYFTEYRRGAGLDDQLVSVWTGPHVGNGTSWVGVIALHRTADDPPFDENTARLIDLLHRRLSGTMWADEADTHNGSAPSNGVGALHNGIDLESRVRALSLAQRRVLPHMLNGQREDRIAELLCRSRHTIHDHISAIYRVFRVHNRMELIVRFGTELRPIAERMAREAAGRRPGSRRP